MKNVHSLFPPSLHYSPFPFYIRPPSTRFHPSLPPFSSIFILSFLTPHHHHSIYPQNSPHTVMTTRYSSARIFQIPIRQHRHPRRFLAPFYLPRPVLTLNVYNQLYYCAVPNRSVRHSVTV